MEKKNLIQFSWSEFENYTSEEMSYFLYLEGKSIECISKLRGIVTNDIKNHIIQGKIKYRFLAKAKNSKELIESISKAGKDDKRVFLENIDSTTKASIIKYILENYTELYHKEKETAIWILGELKAKEGIGILTKATVHKYVNVRRMAVSALGKLQTGDGEPALLRALEDENPQVVSYAIKALSKLSSEKAKEKVQQLHKKTENSAVLRAAEEYLKDTKGV